jgi:hypothetical protein
MPYVLLARSVYTAKLHYRARLSFLGKLLLQSMHICLCAAWTVFLWRVSSDFRENSVLQIKQDANTTFVECCVLMCALRLKFRVKVFWHWEHGHQCCLGSSFNSRKGKVSLRDGIFHPPNLFSPVMLGSLSALMIGKMVIILLCSCMLAFILIDNT